MMEKLNEIEKHLINNEMNILHNNKNFKSISFLGTSSKMFVIQKYKHNLMCETEVTIQTAKDSSRSKTFLRMIPGTKLIKTCYYYVQYTSHC